ncbi:hypothetical protein [uncultured Thiothrix sp.]|uniref:hypothetical protein n=1 Tax=uncultured Thiothrix sp. TaxID=223185 RepID=UPI0026291B76|nr:hypothetical protein [uncultured Thiothrix sp.]HMT93211.1 hypothetical protein [Thiolinea sp.]
MKTLSYSLLIPLVFSMQANAYALSCEVDFRAKRDVQETHWFGNIERPEFRSGTVAGMGENSRDCERDALAPIIAEGWQITFQRTRMMQAEG